MAKSLLTTIDQSKSIEGQIVMAMRSGIYRKKAWLLVESAIDQKVYKRLFTSNAIILPAVGPGGQRPNCWFVEQIVRNILRIGCTQYILGIRDTDYTRYWHERTYTLPRNIVHTHCRDMEMVLLSSKSSLKALIKWDKDFPQRIDDCEQYIRFMGYLRVWHDNYLYKSPDHNLKKFRWGRILIDNTQTVAPDWKHRLTDRFNAICGTGLTVGDVEDYAKTIGLDKLSRYDICRGHDYLPCLANRMVRTDKYSETTIRNKMSENYNRTEFWKSKTGVRIKAVISPWKLRLTK